MSHYDVLGVAPVADEGQLRQAYVALARRHHPDRAGGDAERMRAVNEAWAVLSDPVRRARYDATLGVGSPSSAVPSRPAHSSPRDPRYPWDQVDPVEADLVEADADDRPIRANVKLPPWVSLLPVGLFAAAVSTFSVGLVLTSEPLIGLAFVSLILSCLFFLAAPFIALLASRVGDQRSEQ